MEIVIKEQNGFMPTTVIIIRENNVEVIENNKSRILKYTPEQIKEIFYAFTVIIKKWSSKYIQDNIIDDEIYTITINTIELKKEVYIKNKYPPNWENFIILRNNLVRESLYFY